MADKKKTKKITPPERKLLEFIHQFESKGGDYNIIYGGESLPELTNMTLKEVLDYQEQMKKDGKKSTAVGAHQFINKTLKEEIEKQKLPLNTKFTPEIQDSLILNRLKNYRGLDKFLKGEIDTSTFAKNLSKEFASLPNPETGYSYYDGDGLNKSLVDVDKFIATLDNIKSPDLKKNDKNLNVNPSVIENNNNIDEGTKEELLKLNKEGLIGDTLKKELQDNVPSMFSTIEGYGNIGKPKLNKEIEKTINNNVKKKKNNLGFNKTINALPEDTPSFSSDFKLLNTTFNQGGLINKFNEGGSHEENPLGGIPLGENNSGGMNLVEEGETMYGDYIFSDSITLDKDTAKRFNIDKKYIGKTLSDISKKYNAEIEERPFDQIVKGTVKRELDKLTMVNELLRPKDNNTSFEGGGFTDSLFGKGLQEGATGSEVMGSVGAGLGALNTGLELANTAFGDTGIDTSGRTVGPEVNVAGKTLESTMKGAQAGMAFGPLGAAVGGVLGGAAGLIGGNKAKKEAAKAQHNYDLNMSNQAKPQYYNTGGGLDTDKKKRRDLTPEEKEALRNKLNKGDTFSPDAADNYDPWGTGGIFETVESYSDQYPKLNLGKYKDVDYFNTSVNKDGRYTLYNTKNNPQNAQGYKQQMNYIKSLNPDANIAYNSDSGFRPLNQLKHGGNTLYEDGRKKETPVSLLSALGYTDIIDEKNRYNTGNDLINSLNIENDLQNLNKNVVSSKNINDRLSTNTNNKKLNLEGALSKYGNDALRLIPIARNLLKKGPEAETTKFSRLDNRYKPNYVDEISLLNKFNNQSNNIKNSLTEASGGDQGALRSNLLQAHLNTLKGTSDAMFTTDRMNAREDQFSQSFNKDTDIRNQQIDMQEVIANEQNRSVAQAQKDAMRNAAFEDIGLLGREGKVGNILKKTTGYTPDGEKYNPDVGFLSSLLRNVYAKKGGLLEFNEYLKQKYDGGK